MLTARRSALLPRLALAALVSCQKTPIQRDPPLAPPSVSAPSAAPSASEALPGAAAPDPSRQLVDGLAWSPSGRSFATWCGHARAPAPPDGGNLGAPCPVHVWDRASGAVRATFDVPCAHDLFVVHWSPSEALFSVSDYDSVRVWRLADRTLLVETGALAMYGAHIYSPDETMLLWGNVFGAVELLSLPSGKVIKHIRLHDGAASLGWNATWDKRSKLLLMTLEHGLPEIWNGRTLTRIQTLRTPGEKDRDNVLAMWGSDDRTVVLAGTDRLVAVADAASGAVRVLRRPEPRPEEPAIPMLSAVLDDDRKRLVILEASGLLEEWDLSTSKRREILPRAEQPSWLNQVQLAPDGRHLSMNRSEGLEIASLDTPGAARRIEGPAAADAGPTALEFVGWGEGGALFAQGGETLYALRADGTIDWQMPVRGRRALSPDRRFLAIADRDLTMIRLADRRTITLRLRLSDGRPASVADAGGGKVMSSADLEAFWDGK